MRLRNIGMGLLLLMAVPVLLAASSGPLLPTIKDNGEDTHVSMRIPGFLIRLGARFIPDKDAEAQAAVKHIRGVRLDVREGAYYPANADEQLDLEAARHARNGYTPLMSIHSSEERVNISARLDRKGRIRQLAVVVADGESFANIQLHTKIDPAELGAVLQAAGVDTHHLGGQKTPTPASEVAVDEVPRTVQASTPSAEG